MCVLICTRKCWNDNIIWTDKSDMSFRKEKYLIFVPHFIRCNNYIIFWDKGDKGFMWYDCYDIES